MRKLNIDEEKLKDIIENIINDNFLGISMKNLNQSLKDYGVKVSPQIVRRNLVQLEKERRIKFKAGKLKHG